MIYQLRGTCASGKTSAVRPFVDEYESESIDVGPDHEFALVKIPGKTSKVSKAKAQRLGVPESEWTPATTHIGFRLPGDLVVLGKYGRAKSGGVEGVPQDWIRDLVERCGMSYRHVLFEGYHASVPTLVWVPMLERLRDARAMGLPFVIAAIDTPFETCMERVHARTPDRQDRKPTNVKVQREHYDQLWTKAMPFFVKRPDLVMASRVDHLNAFEEIRTALRSDGWNG